MCHAASSRSFVAKALLVSAVFLVLAPISVLVHEAVEHGAQDVSHCACLVCHSTTHTPMNIDVRYLAIVVNDGIRISCTPESHAVRALEFWSAVSGRSPPTI